MNIDILKEKITSVLQNMENKDWVSCKITYQFAPFINKGFVSLPVFFDSKNEKMDFYMNYNLDLNNLLYKFIYWSKTVNNSSDNQILFSVNRDDYSNALISLNFNQQIEDNFQNNLPKSKKGKTLPWWKIESETIGLGE